MDRKLLGMDGVNVNRQAWSGALKLIAAVSRRSRVRWAFVLLALLVVSAATPIDILILNDPDLGDRATESPLTGDQIQATAARLFSDTAYPLVLLPSFARSIVLDAPPGALNAGLRPLPMRRVRVLARAHLGPQAVRPSTPDSDPA